MTMCVFSHPLGILRAGMELVWNRVFLSRCLGLRRVGKSRCHLRRAPQASLFSSAFSGALPQI